MITTPLCFKIFVRYARKPIWAPTAPSKLFRIADHTFYSPEEINQIKVLHAAYKAQELSIQEFMKHEFYLPASQTGGLPQEFILKEAEVERQIIEENNQTNARIAKEKEEMMNKIMQDMEAKLLEEKQRLEEQLLEKAQQVDNYIKEQQADPNSFVTTENIDEMIDKAMSSPVSYEFYIDIKGRRYIPGPEVPSK